MTDKIKDVRDQLWSQQPEPEPKYKALLHFDIQVDVQFIILNKKKMISEFIRISYCPIILMIEICNSDENESFSIGKGIILNFILKDENNKNERSLNGRETSDLDTYKTTTN